MAWVDYGNVRNFVKISPICKDKMPIFLNERIFAEGYIGHPITGKSVKYRRYFPTF